MAKKNRKGNCEWETYLVIINSVTVNFKKIGYWSFFHFVCVNKQEVLDLFKDGCMYTITLIFFS